MPRANARSLEPSPSSPRQPCSPPAETAPRKTRSTPPSAAIVATEAQDGSTLSLRPGQRLEIRLHGNETIDPPLAWSLAAAPPILRPVGAEILSDDPRADGAGATWIFRFTAVSQGEGRLVFSGGESGRRASFRVESADGH